MNSEIFKLILQAGSIVTPILLAILGAYIKLKIQIGVLQSDVDNLALMMGTKRALSEFKEKKGEKK